MKNWIRFFIFFVILLINIIGGFYVIIESTKNLPYQKTQLYMNPFMDQQCMNCGKK